MKTFPNKHFAMFICLALLLGTVSPTLAKGPAGGECNKAVCVYTADPPEAIQGHEETVFIGGTGFDAGSSVRFLVSGTRDDSQINVLTVELVQDPTSENNGKLKAYIRVTKAALVTEYDIEVQTRSGRKGKGTTLFSVKENPNQSSDVFTSIDIKAGYYKVLDDGSYQELEFEEPFDGPYDGGNHPWSVRVEYGDYSFFYDFDNWSANTLVEIPRSCYVGVSPIDPPTAGRYDCFEGGGNAELWPHGGLVSIPLADMKWTNKTVAKNGREQDEPGFCPLLSAVGDAEGYLEFGATRYTIFFMEGCDPADGCPITIRTLSYSGVSQQQGGGQLVLLHPFHDLAGLPDPYGALPDIGRMPLTAFVDPQYSPSWPAPGELNIFTEPQDLPIDKFRIEFYSGKNGALVAVCETEPDTVNNIRFVAAPPSPLP